jgi:hypothetical protein
MKIETFLPFFPGFYESVLHNPDMDYHLWRELVSVDDRLPRELFLEWSEKSRSPYTELECRWEDYQNDIAKAYCAVVEEYINDNQVLRDGVQINYSHIWSPKYYNFETDRLYCDLIINAPDAIQYCADHAEAFEKYLTERFKSRDGFISFMSYDPVDWTDASEWDSRHPGHIIEFILQNEYGRDTINQFALEALEKVDYSEYCSFHTELEEFLDSDRCAEIAREYTKQKWQCKEYIRSMKETERAKKIAAEAIAHLKEWLSREIDKALEV